MCKRTHQNLDQFLLFTPTVDRTQARIQDFGQGPSGVLTPRGALSPKFAQNRGCSLKIA